MKLISAILLFVFSISLTGFSVDIHFCEGKLTDVAFFSEASCICDNHEFEEKSCCQHQKENAKDCHTSNAALTKNKPCCSNEELVVQALKFDSTNPTVKSHAKVIYLQANQLDIVKINDVKTIHLFSNSSKQNFNKDFQSTNCIWRI